jgi:pyruvate-formate lyase-activating enzyme
MTADSEDIKNVAEAISIRTGAKLRTRALLHYTTPVKLKNLILCEAEKRLHTLHPNSRPYRAIIDVSNACSLRCPYCATGAREFGRPPGFIPLENVQQLMEKVGKHLYVAFLYNWGEPLMHPEIGKVVECVHSHDVMTIISSHLNTRDRSKLEALLNSGLDHLIASIDGATQAVYEQYRVKGRLDIVLDNLSFMVEYKRRHKLRTPTIEWQYLIFEHNKHEVDMARRIAAKLGLDAFRATPGYVPEKPLEPFERVSSCNFLWDTVTLQVDGGIGACCHHIDKADDFASSFSEPFPQTWHSLRFTQARSLFNAKASRKLPDQLIHPCLSCPITQVQPHLAGRYAASGSSNKSTPEVATISLTNVVRSKTVSAGTAHNSPLEDSREAV